MRLPPAVIAAIPLLAILESAPGTIRAQENSVRLEFAGDSARSTIIGSFKRAGMVYVSLNDLAQVFNLGTYEGREMQKFEVKRLPIRLKVAGGNPFVVVTDDAGHQNVVQLPAPVMFAARAYFVPLAPFLPLLRPVLGINASYNPRSGVLGIGTAAAASAYDIPSLRLEAKSNGMLIRIAATKKLREYESWMRADGWLYLTVGEARADIAAINAVRPSGLVRNIVAIQSPTSVQLTFRLSGKIATSEIMTDDASDDLLLLIRTPGAQEAPPPPKTEMPPGMSQSVTPRDTARTVRPDTPRSAGQDAHPVATADTSGTTGGEAAGVKAAKKRNGGPPPAAIKSDAAAFQARKDREVSADLDTERDKWKLDVIVLDAGHGGYDPGTIGVSGVKEKTVALGIVLKLGALMTKNLKDVTVVYTRKDDRFIELDKRGKIANEAGGKLFISVHCNSLPRKPSKTRGFEVYLLRPGRTEEAVAIAERENSVIELEPGYEEKYPELTEENFILVTMAQSAHVKASEVFADLVQKEISSRTSIPNRGVKQAGFYVLVGAAMPNVLVESAYLSNREDEKFLRSDTGQQKIAESLYRAVKKYKEEYEKLLQEGKDFGEAR